MAKIAKNTANKGTKEAPDMKDLTYDTRPTEPTVGRPEELVPEDKNVAGADPETVKLERERRRYVRRRGGYRKNLNQHDRKRADQLSGQVGKPVEDGWMPLHIEGYDNIEHGARRGREWNAKDNTKA